MAYFWSVPEEGRPISEETLVLTVDGIRQASVWFLGGHVERPDGWHVTFAPSLKSLSNNPCFETAEDAKRYAEEVCGLNTERRSVPPA
jgi:hypothetical protein